MALYEKTIWSNDITPLNEGNMNHIEDGIFNVSQTAFINSTLNYLNDILTITFENAGNVVVDSKNITIPTSDSLINLQYDSVENTLTYTKRNGNPTLVMNLYDSSKLYTITEINSAFQEINIEED